MCMSGSSVLYLLEMFIPCLGLCIPVIKERKHFLKGAGMVFATMIGIFFSLTFMNGFFANVATAGNMAQRNVSVMLILFWFLVNWSVLIAFIRIVTGSSLGMAIYLFALAYAIEHIFYCIRLFVEYMSEGKIADNAWFIYIPCLVGSFFLAYFWFAKKTVYKKQYITDNITSSTYVVVILLLVWGLSMLATTWNFEKYHSVYAGICCIFILLNQRDQMLREIDRIEFANKEQLWEKSKIRYQISKESMAVVNQHFHDMKHQIKALSRMENSESRKAYLQEMESNIAAYDAVVRTGNDYLDTVLTEKKLTCQTKHIAMSCIADGSQLTFMDELDLYTLMGNVLDNAIEANEKICEYDKRFISVQIQNKKGIILVEVVNPYVGELVMRGGIPGTTKEDTYSHGYGIGSIRTLTEKYGGQMILKAENHRFLLRLIFQNNS